MYVCSHDKGFVFEYAHTCVPTYVGMRERGREIGLEKVIVYMSERETCRLSVTKFVKILPLW